MTPDPDIRAVPGGRKFFFAAGLVAVTILARLPFIPAPGFPADQGQFFAWTMHSRSDGLGSLYERQTEGSARYRSNYPPGYLLVLRALAEPLVRFIPSTARPGQIFQDIVAGRPTPEVIRAAIVLKLPAVAADAMLVLLLLVWLERRLGLRPALIIATAYALMPVVIHNSAVWCQMDAVATLLMVVSLEAARRRRMLAMTVLATLACLTKAQAAMLLPVWTGCLAAWIVADWKRAIQVFGAAIVTAVAVIAPFFGHWDGLCRAYTGAADYYPFVHLNGFSVWFLFNPLVAPHLSERLTDWYMRDDVARLLGVTPRMMGLFAILFVWGWVFAWVYRSREAGIEWAAKLLPLAFFVLSTGMHERYIFPAIGLWAWSGLRNRREWIGWIMMGLAATMNVLWVWPGPAQSWWTDAALHALRKSWLELAPGVWCSVVLLIVFALTAARGPMLRRVTSAEA